MTSSTLHTLLVAIDDSPAALAAASAAIDLAGHLGARVRFLHVLGDGELVRALTTIDHGERLQERRSRATASLLEHVLAQARHAGVPADTLGVDGDPADVILAQSRHWPADLVVLGRSGPRRAGQPYVGAVSRQVLELSDVPVLVVPARG
jgi:nucleotide-binding universal stress UspA family protein